ncbi:MAG: NnrU family protein [Herminiimonas sp.]|nr:NnrU family protein [Herminiimonas sp.]
MIILVSGLVLFLGVHLVPTLPGMRNRLLESYGEKRYKGVFALISALGLALIVIGYSRAPSEPRLFNPFPGAIAIAPIAMAVSFVLLAAANMRTHIRRAVRHPMLIGIGIWAMVHLLANGHAKATLLFGAFLAYAVIDIISATGRHAVKPFKPVAKQDAIAVAAGILLALLVMTFHRQLFGVRAVVWGI